MNTSRATVRNGRIEVQAPEDWPDGTEVLVEVTPVPPERIGLAESEWRDDPEALADWDAWLKTIEPIELTAEEQAAHDRFTAEVGQFTVEAVRKQMAEGSDP